MAKQSSVGPVKMPWEKGHYSEILVFAFAGILGAIMGATLIHHYRRATKRG